MTGSQARALLRLPLALASLVLYLLLRGLARRAPGPRSDPGGPRWRIYDKTLFARPIFFYGLLLLAPRWNPHALLGAAGPVTVRRAIRFDPEVANAAAESWSAVVYAAPGTRTVAWSGSAGEASGVQDRGSFELPPGQYALYLRYYGLRAGARLPALEVDGAPALPEAAALAEAQEGYRDLSTRRSWFARVVHYHLQPLLVLAPWLPAGLVRGLLLPVGNPETTFRYGAIEAGESLELHADAALLAGWFVFACRYRWDSLPAAWGELRADAPRLVLGPAGGRGFWLLRLHRRVPGAPDALLEGLVVKVGADRGG